MLSRLAGSLMATTCRLCATGDSSSARRKQRPMRPYPLMASRFGFSNLLGGLGRLLLGFLAFGGDAGFIRVVMHLGHLERFLGRAALVTPETERAEVGVEDDDAL